MIVLGQGVLTGAGKRDKGLRSWLAAWLRTAVTTDWWTIGDVRRTYPSADGVRLASGTVVTIFNVKGNQWRLATWIDYEAQIVQVLAVMTHAEYDKDLWKGRY